MEPLAARWPEKPPVPPLLRQPTAGGSRGLTHLPARRAAGPSPAAPVPAPGRKMGGQEGGRPSSARRAAPHLSAAGLPPREPLTSSAPHGQQLPRGGRTRRSAVPRHAPPDPEVPAGRALAPPRRSAPWRAGGPEPPRGRGGGVKGPPRGSAASPPLLTSGNRHEHLHPRQSGVSNAERKTIRVTKGKQKTKLFLNLYERIWFGKPIPSLGGEMGAQNRAASREHYLNARQQLLFFENSPIFIVRI